MLAAILTHFLFFTFAFFIAKKFNKVCLVDLFWPLGLMLPIFYLNFYFKTSFYFQQKLVALLVIAWGLRLFFYLFIRMRGKGDDPRYLAMIERKKWRWPQIYGGVFIAQGIFSLVIAAPFYFWRFSKSVNNNLDFYFGLVIAVIGLILETMADFSLSRFKKDLKNKGRLCTVFPWNFSRHPNYLGELMFWWGIWLMSFSFHQGAILSIISPLLLTYLIVYVTGVGPKEKMLEKYPEFLEYKSRVRKFI